MSRDSTLVVYVFWACIDVIVIAWLFVTLAR